MEDPLFTWEYRVMLRDTQRTSEWFVITPEGRQVGPVTTDLLVRGISANKVPRDALVARAGDPAWQDMLDVPEIFSALRALS